MDHWKTPPSLYPVASSGAEFLPTVPMYIYAQDIVGYDVGC